MPGVGGDQEIKFQVENPDKTSAGCKVSDSQGPSGGIGTHAFA